MVVMYLAFGFDILSVAGYAFVTQPWQAMAIAFAGGGSLAVGMIVWGTLMHKLVPVALQGRVRSVDWLVSIGLVPVSFAITGPIAGLIGVSTTLVGAGVLGGIATVVFMLVPGLYDTEGDPRLRDTHEDGIEVDEPEPVATAH
jgi:DHA3 family tetracycline resistance protein-like MFS transporter